MDRSVESPISPQDNLVLRIKPEDAVASCCTGNYRAPTFNSASPRPNTNSAFGERGYNSTADINPEEFTLNGSKTSQVDNYQRTTIKRENLDETCDHGNNCHGDTGPNPDVRRDVMILNEQTTQEYRTSTEYSEIEAPSNVTREYPTGPVQYESYRTTPGPQNECESRVFSSEKRLRRTHHFDAFELPRGPPDPPHPAKQDLSRLQPVPFSTRTSPPFFGISRDGELSDPSLLSGPRRQSPQEDFSRYIRQQGFEHEAFHESPSLRGDRRINRQVPSTLEFNRQYQRDVDIRRQRQGSPPEKFEQRFPTEYSGPQTSRKDTYRGHLLADDEEPVWKQYQWYRDKKRPQSQQIRQEKAEQTIFMQYNEIRHRRFKEGRVVNGGVKQGMELVPHPHSAKTALSSPHNTDQSLGYLDEEKNPRGSPEYLGAHSARLTRQPNENNGESYTSTSLSAQGENTSLTVTPCANIERVTSERNKIESGERIQDAFDAGCGDRNVAFSFRSAVPTSEDLGGSNEQDDGAQEEISSTTDEDVGFFPENVQRSNRTVQKIIRLNRIVKAVKNIRKREQSCGGGTRNEHQTTKKMKKCLASEHCAANEASKKHSLGRNEKVASPPRGSEHDEDEESDTEKTADEVETANDILHEPPNAKSPALETRDTLCCSELFSGISDVSTSGSDQELAPMKQNDALTETLGNDDNGNDDDVICYVNGLLSLPGFKETKYNITLGELKRRMNPPETLTRVEMISYVRQAKSSGRILLDKNNIVTANRSHPTILSRVCESEAQLLADGIHKMNKQYMPLATLARKTVDAYKDCGCDVKDCEDCRLKLRRRIVDVEITRNSIKELQKLIDESREESDLQTFELASHNFGVTNMCNHLSLLDDYFKVLLLTLQDE